MFTRLTFIKVPLERVDDLKRIYLNEIVPVLKHQRGNTGARLLEPTNNTDEFISLTEWQSEADANLYDSSGTYRSLVDKIKDIFTSRPVLKSYNVAESEVLASV